MPKSKNFLGTVGISLRMEGRYMVPSDFTTQPELAEHTSLLIRANNYLFRIFTLELFMPSLMQLEILVETTLLIQTYLLEANGLNQHQIVPIMLYIDIQVNLSSLPTTEYVSGTTFLARKGPQSVQGGKSL
jgi:hypothetical protein